MTIHSFLSPSKSRTPLQDHSASLLSDAKLPPKHTAQKEKEKERKGEGRLDRQPEGPAAPSEEGGSPRQPGGTAEAPEGAGARGTAVPTPDRAGTGPGKGHRRRAKKPVQKTTSVPGTRLGDAILTAELNLTFRPQSEEQQRIGDLIQQGAEEGLEVRHIEGKGRGVFASRSFRKGQFVVEYHGDLLETKDAKKREEEYGRNPATGCYMYYFQYLSKTYCVDATKETQRLGRLVNHSKAGNCQTKLHGINGKPHLILVASRDIEKGEELLYDYGDRSKESIAAHPWLKY
ncbi:N-lysine methyltransferase KMT5A-like [Anguilla rostrata]|uniref:N-lysine methyltransferase KMT5A-like n=1 Tax=Anguilla rostrata TaxID=7938 RepID=UPI0030D1BD87